MDETFLRLGHGRSWAGGGGGGPDVITPLRGSCRPVGCSTKGLAELQYAPSEVGSYRTSCESRAEQRGLPLPNGGELWGVRTAWSRFPESRGVPDLDSLDQNLTPDRADSSVRPARGFEAGVWHGACARRRLSVSQRITTLGSSVQPDEGRQRAASSDLDHYPAAIAGSERASA